MTVSSTISVFCRDGVFRTVYCHLHGEPTWNGRILHTHYATGQQAEALVEHGDIRCLGPLRIPLYSITDWHRSPISDSHPFDQPGT